MAVSDDISDLWWLRDRPAESQAGWALGVRMGEMAQQREITSYYKALQADQIRSRIQLQNAQMVDAVARSKAMGEMSSFLSETAAKNDWLNPEAEAKFWAFGSRWPQVYDHNMLVNIHQHTFGNAKASQDRFDQILLREATGGATGTATIRNKDEIVRLQNLARVAESEGDTEGAQRLTEQWKMMAQGANMALPETGAPQIQKTTIDGHDFYFFRSGRGQVHQVKVPDESKIPPEEMKLYQAELDAVRRRLEFGVFDNPKLPGGTDWDKFNAEIKAAYDRHHRTAKPSTEPTANPAYDPSDPLGLFIK